MKDVITPNMMKIALMRYDSEMIPFDMIIKDLEMIENNNRPAIRIFKTKMEVDYFKMEGGDLAGTIDSTTYKGKFTEPKKEPLYICRSKKNTYYVESSFDFSRENTG